MIIFLPGAVSVPFEDPTLQVNPETTVTWQNLLRESKLPVETARTGRTTMTPPWLSSGASGKNGR